MDIRTILFADMVLQICCAVGMLLMSRSVPGFRGMRWFAAAYTTGTLGFLLAILNGTLPAPYTFYVGRCLVLASAVLLTQGIADFVVPSSNTLTWGLILLAAFAVADFCFLFSPDSSRVEVITFGIAFGAQLLVGVFVLLSHESPGERTASRTTAALLGGLALLSFARALAIPVRHIPADFFVEDPKRFAGMVLFMVFSLGLTFAIFWMMTSRLRNQLELQARTDSLTGVMNRRAVEIAGQTELAACRRRGAPLSVLAIDLDYFKNLNDTYGHAAGDVMLQTIARLLTQCLRSSDLVARFGGEEFIAVLPERNAARAFEIAERLRGRIAAVQVLFESHLLQVTASFGIAALTGGESWGELLRRADRALYAAKQAGRNCTCDHAALLASPERFPARNARASD